MQHITCHVKTSKSYFILLSILQSATLIFYKIRNEYLVHIPCGSNWKNVKFVPVVYSQFVNAILLNIQKATSQLLLKTQKWFWYQWNREKKIFPLMKLFSFVLKKITKAYSLNLILKKKKKKKIHRRKNNTTTRVLKPISL